MRPSVAVVVAGLRMPVRRAVSVRMLFVLRLRAMFVLVVVIGVRVRVDVRDPVGMAVFV
jgi:hypothetical protein